MFQLDFLACSKILAQRFAFSMGWKMWRNEFVWSESAPGTEGLHSPGLKDRTIQRRRMRCCQWFPFTRAQMPSPRRGFLMWTGSLHNVFRISVLITARKSVPVPALIYKELGYADLNDFLTKLVWIRSLFLPFQGSSILTTYASLNW